MTLSHAVAAVVTYFPLSVGLTFYNKWVVKDFHYPLFMICCHYVLKFLLAALMRRCRKSKSTHGSVLSWEDYVLRLAPVGLAATIDIGLSTWSLEFISVTLYTMSKSTVIIFILIMSVLMGLEKPSMSLVAIVLLIASGLFLFTYKSTQFDLLGFCLVELAALCSGIRWCLCQVIMQKKKMGLEHPFDMIYYAQPWMLVGIFPLLFVFEGKSIGLSSQLLDYRFLSDAARPLLSIGLGSFLAFGMEVSEYALLISTSSLTLSVVGVVKEVFTLYLGQHFSSQKLSILNKAGLVACVAGVLLHVVSKYRKAKTEATKPPEVEEAEKFELLDDCQFSDAEPPR